MRNFQVITDQEKLREKSRDIWGTGGTLLRLLKKTLSQYPQGVGLSAIQIGVPERVAIVDISSSVEKPSWWMVNFKNNRYF